MRKMIMAFIAAFALIAVGLIVLMVFAVLNGGVSFSHGSINMKLVKTENVSLDGIDKIDITYTSADVEFFASDTDELIFKEYMNYTPKDEELSSLETHGNELTIEKGHDRSIAHFLQFSHGHSIEIYLPEGYTGAISVEASSGNINSDLVLKLSEFRAESSSGNIRMNEVYAQNISAKASSGNINFEIAEGNREFSATSGNIKVKGGAGDGEFDTSSGNIRVENVSGHINATASSGEMDVVNSMGGGSFKTSSGNITLEFTSLTEDLKAGASSGNVSLTIPGDASFNFTADTSSGNINTFFDDSLSYNKRGNSAQGTVGENPVINVELSATSGNVRVHQ